MTARKVLEAICGGRLWVEELMAAHTSFRIGGPADYFAVAERVEEICRLMRAARSLGLPCLILGRGTNILVGDRGVRGLVISNRARGYAFHGLSRNGAETIGVMAEVGAPLAALARRTAALGWAGLEFAIAIPGTVGGAIVMNAGAHGGCIADTLQTVALWDGDSLRRRKTQELELGYRTSRFRAAREQEAILAADFLLRRGDPESLLARVREYRQWRHTTQPQEPSAGSVFRNPPGQAAGYLLEQAGLKGLCRGGAQISPQHANFIVNTGGATATDVRALMETARERVMQRFGIPLEPEIELVGEW